MRFLRGPYFVVACILAVAIGVVAGSGWFPRTWRAVEQSPTTLGFGAPPGPLRLFEKEHDEYRGRLGAALQGSVPEHTSLFSLITMGDFSEANGGCHRITRRCEVTNLTPFFRALLAESDPKIEDLFLVKDWPPGKPRAGGIRTAFILGKDGKLKIVVEAPGEVREMMARVMAGGAGEDRRIGFRLLDRSERPDMSVYPPKSKSWAVFMADDPGELKRLPDGGLASLVLQDTGERTLSKLTITPGLEQRHRFYGVLKGKP